MTLSAPITHKKHHQENTPVDIAIHLSSTRAPTVTKASHSSLEMTGVLRWFLTVMGCFALHGLRLDGAAQAGTLTATCQRQLDEARHQLRGLDPREGP